MNHPHLDCALPVRAFPSLQLEHPEAPNAEGQDPRLRNARQGLHVGHTEDLVEQHATDDAAVLDGPWLLFFWQGRFRKNWQQLLVENLATSAK